MRKSLITACFVTATLVLLIWGTPVFPDRLDAQPPAFQSSPLSLAPYESVLRLPVSIATSTLAEALDEQVPKELRGTQDLNIGGNVHGERLDYTIRRGRIAVSADADRIHVRTPLTGRATARADLCPFGRAFGCTSIRESADIRATANANFSGIRIDPDWRPRAELTLDVNVTRAEVRLLGNLIPISFRGRLTEEINRSLPNVTDEFNNMLDELNLHSMLAAAWTSMHRTIRLSTRPDAWLAVQPRSMGASLVAASDDVVTASVLLSADAAIYIGTEPVIEQGPLRREPLSPDAAAPAFRLRVPVIAELDELAAQLNACCIPLSVALDGDVSLSLFDLILREHQGRLLLGVRFTTSGWWRPRGTLYVLATPVLSENTLGLEALEFTVESESILTEAAIGLARSTILNHLQQVLRINMVGYYEDATAIMQSALAQLDPGQDIDLRVDVGGVRLVEVAVGDSQVAFVGEVTGEAIVEVANP